MNFNYLLYRMGYMIISTLVMLYFSSIYCSICWGLYLASEQDAIRSNEWKSEIYMYIYMYIVL